MRVHIRQGLFACLVALLAILALPASVQAQDTAATSGVASGVEALTPAQAKALADLLADDATRGALIDALNRTGEPPQASDTSGETVTEAVTGAVEDEATDPGETSFSRRIAAATQDTAERIAGSLGRFWQGFSRAPETLGSALSINPDIILTALRDLALVIVATVLLYNVLRWIAKRLFRRMGNLAGDAGPAQTALIIVTSVIIDAIVVVIAWGAGYALAIAAFGDAGQIGIRQTMYLNAFLIVEMVKVLIRAVMSPTTAQLRTVNVPDRGARYVARWLTFLVSLLGYGQLLVVPIINQNVNFTTGRGVSTLISAVAIAILIWMVLKWRRVVADWLLGERRLSEGRGLLKFLARNWHVPALIYLVVVLAIVLARPGGILFPLLGTSAKVLGAIVLGFIASNLVSRAIMRGVRVPSGVSQRLPLLERRLNAFVPRVLTILKVAIVLAVVMFTLNTVGVLDVQGWMESQIGVRTTAVVLRVAVILTVAFLIWLAVNSWVDFRLNPEFGSVPTSREQTLLALLRNAVTIVLVVITLMFVLSEVGIDIAPLLASAGVLGLAIGFGAQKLVQDIITGVFIQLENAMNVGDVVTVGGTTGTIERLTIRSVSLRDLHGAFHIIPFSSVDMVTNYMREFAFCVTDMGIAYREDIGEAKQAMFDGFEELRANPDWGPHILEDLQWFGLNSFGASEVVVRARIKTVPGQQWGIGRAYNEILKRIFDERGIEIPFPHQTIYFGEDKQGQAPAAPVRMTIEQTPKSAPAPSGGTTGQPDTLDSSINTSPDDEPPGDR